MTPSAPSFSLRDVTEDDLPRFYEFERDADAAHIAGFTPTAPNDYDAFLARWRKMLDTPDLPRKTIVIDGQVVGNVVTFPMGASIGVAYWIDRAFWGQGIASRALAVFLTEVPTRPLYARAAKDNAGSLRVLEKCGFVITGEGKMFSNVRGEDIEDWILTLGE